MFERLLHPARDRQNKRLAAGCFARKLGVECALHSGRAMPVDIGEAEHMGGEIGLGIEPVRFAAERQSGLPQRIDRLDQPGGGAATKIDEALVRTDQGEPAEFVALGHQQRELAREFELVADDLRRVECDGPGIDRSCQRLAFAIDDVTAFGDQRGNQRLAPGMVAERCKPDEAN